MFFVCVFKSIEIKMYSRSSGQEIWIDVEVFLIVFIFSNHTFPFLLSFLIFSAVVSSKREQQHSSTG